MDENELTTEQKIKYVQDTLFVISGKWKLPILIAMSQGHSRFRDLQRSMPPISTRVLSRELKDLEENKLVKRTVLDTLPATVEYTVMPYCKSLTAVVDELIIWGKNHRKKVVEK